MIKSQEEIDKSVHNEGRVERNTVFSQPPPHQANDFVLPLESACIVIDKLEVSGDFSGGVFANKAMKHAIGRCIGSAGVAKLATDLQDYIIRAGYITSRVEVPDQDLSTKVLRLNIVAGKLGEIIINNRRVSKKVLPLRAGDTLNLRDVEQGLEVMQRTPGSLAKIEIKPSGEPGYSDVVINAEKSQNWNIKTWVNNWGDKSTGRILAGGALYLYNPVGLNDIFSLSGSKNIDSNSGSYQNVNGYYSVPFGYWDYDVFYSVSKSSQQVGYNALNLTYTGKNQYLDLKASRVLYRDRERKISASAEILKRQASYALNDVDLVLQNRNMTNLRLGGNYKQRLPNAMLEGTLAWQRFVPWLGAERTADMKSGDVSSISQIFSLDANYTRLFNVDNRTFYYNLNAGGQYAPDALTLQDQISVGNRWRVRGFENSPQINGNSGFYTQNNLGYLTGILNAEWYFGIDYGQLWSNQYSEPQFNNAKLMGATTGIKGSITSAMYNLFASTPLIYPEAMPVDRMSFNAEVSYQF